MSEYPTKGKFCRKLREGQKKGGRQPSPYSPNIAIGFSPSIAAPSWSSFQ